MTYKNHLSQQLENSFQCITATFWTEVCIRVAYYDTFLCQCRGLIEQNTSPAGDHFTAILLFNITLRDTS